MGIFEHPDMAVKMMRSQVEEKYGGIKMVFKRKRAAVAAVAVLMFAFIAFAADMMTKTSEVELGDAESSRVEINMDVGELELTGGAKYLMEADFSYNQKRLEPRVDYKIIEGMGELKISHPPRFWPALGTTKSRWDIRLSDNTPICLLVDTSSGNADLDLAGINVTGLDVDSSSGNMGLLMPGDFPEVSTIQFDQSSGDVNAELSGNFPSLKSVDLDTSSGKIELLMPGTFGSPLKLDLGTSSGELVLKMDGTYEAPASLKLDASSANIHIDLSGDWKKGLSGKIRYSSGHVLLTLPNDIGVKVQVDKGSGKVDALDFQRSGNTYTSTGYEKAAVKMTLKVSSSSGGLVLEYE